MLTNVPLDYIEKLIDEAETEEHIFHSKALVVSYKLPSGFTIQGTSAIIDPEYFDIVKGREIARQDAIKQMWKLEGYRRQVELSNLGIL